MMTVLAVALLLAAPQQNDPTLRLLAELLNANAAPGFEGPVRDILRREWKPLLKERHTDGIGNLIGTAPGEGGPRVLLVAHMDEVGFLVRHIDERGFVYKNRAARCADGVPGHRPSSSSTAAWCRTTIMWKR